MRKAAFWKTDWFLGVVVSLVLIVGSGSDLIQSLERKAYDMGVVMASRTPSDKIAVIAIDDVSIANLGRWPWPRDLHAKLTDLLVGAKAKVIANTVLFSEPQRDPGYDAISKLLDIYGKMVPALPPAEPGMPLILPAGVSPELVQMGDLLRDAEASLNTDRKLGESYARAQRVILPMVFQLGEQQGKPDSVLPGYILNSQLKQVAGDGAPLTAVGVAYPIEILGSKASAIGHLNASYDVDGGVRTDPLVLRYFDQYYPSLSLMIAAKSLNLGPADIKVTLGSEVRLGNLRIPTDFAAQMRTFFYASREGRPAFQVDSFYDVLSGKIPAAKYQDKIVLIGATAAGVGTSQVTPVSPAMAPALTLAHIVSSILNQHFFVAPEWGFYAELVLMLLIAVYLALLLPRLSAGLGAAVTGGLLVVLVGAHFGLMIGPGIWLQFMGAAVLLVVGHLLLTTKRFLVTERGKEKSDAQSAESNRMLALAFQGQGQIDMAWDKFRQVPLGPEVMENLYNLALDFERKRQFNKAEAVFRYMYEYDPKFRDLETRMNRAKQLSETVILGGASSHPGGASIVGGAGGAEKPMLGRYQVEKELGKGAMGIVYLGRDPKINRVVAIKTMALSQEFDEDELKDVKERFFREAETAGRLNHPNIVTMYDAGEEHDLAYIAMEFLKGKDLVPYTKPDNLLPLPKVMSICARVADALDYAHKNHVVHRDVKPANFMYELESDQVKVTDFGIARITDSSKTKTGMVLGTPSYMSPEQLSGKKIDGRSDLFSLGVTLYQMACGQLPFVGDSMAQLMFKISSEAPTDIRTVRPDLPECLVAILDRALTKDIDARYQTGADFAADLRACMNQAGGGGTSTTAVDIQF